MSIGRLRGWRRRVAWTFFLLALMTGALFFGYAVPFADIGAAFVAKELCSRVFLSGRTPAAIKREDFDAYPSFGLFDAVRWQIDRGAGSVETFAPFGTAHAIFRPGLGCAVVPTGTAVAPVSAPTGEAAAPIDPQHADNAPRYAAIRRLVDEAFEEQPGVTPHRTSAVVVLHDGRLVAERYAAGVHSKMPLPGWSLAKTAVNALVGALVAQGRFTVTDPVRLREWQSVGDPRQNITFDQLLRLVDGLDFRDDYWNPYSDVFKMLYRSAAAGGFAASRPIADAPGTRWRYTSGSTNVIMHALAERLEPDEHYSTLPRRMLFDRLGMASATLEADASGQFIGSSYMYATARDWAKLGQLYIQDGWWNGERVLPEGWVAYTTTPTPAAPHGEYGAHVWLKLRDDAGRWLQRSPPDTFHGTGHAGQYLSVVPSRRLVIVRLGVTPTVRGWDQDRFVAAIAAALDNDSATASHGRNGLATSIR